VAVKELFLDDESSVLVKKAVLAEMRREVYIMSCMDHPNIIRLQGIVLDPPSMVRNRNFCSNPFSFSSKLSGFCRSWN